MDSLQYEHIVSVIGSKVAATVEGSGAVVRSGRSNKVKGVSTYPHQIDVSIQTASSLHLIECKCLNRKVLLADVLVLLGRLTDIAAAHPTAAVTASMVSRKGVTRNGTLVAEQFSIQVDKVHSLKQYSFRYKDLDSEAASDGAQTGDSASAHII